MIKRNLGRSYTSKIQKGMPYGSLHKIITINLLNFVVFLEYEAFHTIGILWNQQQKIWSIDIEVYIVEIPKLMQQWRNEQVYPWERMSQDSSFRQAYEAREKTLMDEATKFAHARNGGKKGFKKGKEAIINSWDA